ncbi:hypothetical protein [Vibrio sp. 1F279]|uniref:hypothetical protein n=1 Tax=unclassified Vibrio TaxID=2614977 RepID=UPI00352EEACD
MFQSIQVSSGYSIFRMNGDGPLGMNPKNDGSVDALLKRGNRFTAPFGGFIKAKNIIGLKLGEVEGKLNICHEVDKGFFSVSPTKSL